MTFPASRVGFAVHHARAGERVLMVVPEGRDVAQVLTMLAHFGIRDGEHLRRARGLEGYDTPAGGWIRFLTERTVDTRGRGETADLVLVDAEVRVGAKMLEDLKLCATRIHGEEGELG